MLMLLILFGTQLIPSIRLSWPLVNESLNYFPVKAGFSSLLHRDALWVLETQLLSLIPITYS